MGLGGGDIAQVVVGAVDAGREGAIGNRLNFFNPAGHQIGIGHHHFIGLFLAQILKFFQHFFCGAKIQRCLVIGIGKAFGVHDNPAIVGPFRVDEMAVASGHHRLVVLFAQGNDFAIEIFDVLHGLHRIHFRGGNHKFIVTQRLNFQIVIKAHQVVNDFLGFFIQQSAVYFPRFAGTAHNQPLAVLHQLGLGNPGPFFCKIFQMGHAD